MVRQPESRSASAERMIRDASLARTGAQISARVFRSKLLAAKTDLSPQCNRALGRAHGVAHRAPATGLSPLDGVLVPTFGAFYLAVTLLFPFVAIAVVIQGYQSDIESTWTQHRR